MSMSAQTAAEPRAPVPRGIELIGGRHAIVEEVFAGEYESGWEGEGLTVLDLGANIGAFALWAALRWPRSRVHAYEAHPATFQVLRRNLAGRGDFVAHHAAVTANAEKRATLYARFDGDVEAALAPHAACTFAALDAWEALDVPTLHPHDLPAADVVKLDVEGAEGEILAELDLSATSLVLLEFHDDRNRRAAVERLSGDFALELEDVRPWDPLLGGSRYHPALAGHHHGRLFFTRRGGSRLRRAPLA